MSRLPFGADDLRLPDALREPVREHLAHLRDAYRQRGWGRPAGFGTRPALVVIDLAPFWTNPRHRQMGSPVDAVVEASCRLLEASRAAGVPIVFTTYGYDPAAPATPHDRKVPLAVSPGDERLFELDPRVQRRPSEPLIRKKSASAFKDTHLHTWLTASGVDTVIVAGLSTSHCVYATCRDATDSFRVIVPREAVGERCELFHEVNLLDIELDLGDVLPLADVLTYLGRLRPAP